MTIIRPAPVTGGPEPGAGEGTTPAVVTGGPSAWADDSTASWVLFAPYSLTDGGPSLSAQARATAASALHGTVTVRLAVEVVNADALGTVTVTIYDDDTTTALGSSLVDLSSVPTGNWPPVVAEATILLSGATPAASLHLDVLGLGGSDSPVNVLRVYEVEIEVVAAPSLAPPLRQYPRNDGLAGSVRRLYPPPRSTQRSNRRAGGYL